MLEWFLDLDDILLQKESYFDTETCALVSLYLNRLPKPISLVSHNGNNFDYPILLYHMNSFGKVIQLIL